MASDTQFTVADVLAWARTKPADKSYDYGDTNNCALCQFLKQTGRAVAPNAGGHFWRDAKTDAWDVQHLFPDGRKGLEYALMARTFGGLVEALEKLAPATPVTPSNWRQIDAYLSDIEQVIA